MISVALPLLSPPCTYVRALAGVCLPEVAQRCRCTMELLADGCPLCETNAVSASRNIAADVSRAATQAAFDAEIQKRMAATKQEREAWQANIGAGNSAPAAKASGSSATGATGEAGSRKRPRRKRRTHAQVVAAREQDAREAKYADWQATIGTVLEGQTKAEDEFLAAIRTEDET